MDGKSGILEISSTVLALPVSGYMILGLSCFYLCLVRSALVCSDLINNLPFGESLFSPLGCGWVGLDSARLMTFLLKQKGEGEGDGDGEKGEEGISSERASLLILCETPLLSSFLYGFWWHARGGYGIPTSYVLVSSCEVWGLGVGGLYPHLYL